MGPPCLIPSSIVFSPNPYPICKPERASSAPPSMALSATRAALGSLFHSPLSAKSPVFPPSLQSLMSSLAWRFDPTVAARTGGGAASGYSLQAVGGAAVTSGGGVASGFGCCLRQAAVLRPIVCAATADRRRCYRRSPTLLPSANSGATGGEQGCYRRRTGVLPAHFGAYQRRAGVLPGSQRRPVVLPARRRWCCHRSSVLLPSADGGATSGERVCYQLVSRMLPARHGGAATGVWRRHGCCRRCGESVMVDVAGVFERVGGGPVGWEICSHRRSCGKRR
jgi:hypothetical protein